MRPQPFARRGAVPAIVGALLTGTSLFLPWRYRCTYGSCTAANAFEVFPLDAPAWIVLVLCALVILYAIFDDALEPATLRLGGILASVGIMVFAYWAYATISPATGPGDTLAFIGGLVALIGMVLSPKTD